MSRIGNLSTSQATGDRSALASSAAAEPLLREPPPSAGGAGDGTALAGPEVNQFARDTSNCKSFAGLSLSSATFSETFASDHLRVGSCQSEQDSIRSPRLMPASSAGESSRTSTTLCALSTARPRRRVSSSVTRSVSRFEYSEFDMNLGLILT